jgi:hypothetical protein
MGVPVDKLRLLLDALLRMRVRSRRRHDHLLHATRKYEVSQKMCLSAMMWLTVASTWSGMPTPEPMEDAAPSWLRFGCEIAGVMKVLVACM